MNPSSKTLVKYNGERSDSSWDECFCWAVKVHNFVLELRYSLSIIFAVGSLVIMPVWWKMYESAIYEKESKALDLVMIDRDNNWKKSYIISVIDSLKDFVDLSMLRPKSLLTLEDARRLVPDPVIIKISDYMSRNALPVVILTGFCSLLLENLSEPWNFLDLVFGGTFIMPLVSIFKTLVSIFCPKIWLLPITFVFYNLNLAYKGMNRMLKGRLRNDEETEAEKDVPPDEDGDQSLGTADGGTTNNSGAEESNNE